MKASIVVVVLKSEKIRQTKDTDRVHYNRKITWFCTVACFRHLNLSDRTEYYGVKGPQMYCVAPSTDQVVNGAANPYASIVFTSVYIYEDYFLISLRRLEECCEWILWLPSHC